MSCLLGYACCVGMNKDDDSASNCTKLQGKWEPPLEEDDEEFLGDTILSSHRSSNFRRWRATRVM
jgi:hypothetical protein